MAVAVLSLGLRAMLAIAAIAPMTIALPTRLQADCVGSWLPITTDLFPSNFQMLGAQQVVQSQVEVTVAEKFSVTYYDTYKVVTNILAANETYVLYQCGTVPPAQSQFSVPVKFFEIPLLSVAVPDTTAAAFMEALAVLDRVAYVTPYVDNACLQTLSGPCGLVSSSPTDANVANVSAVISFSSSSISKAIAFQASDDPGTLKRAEWIKFMSTFFNLEAQANSIYSAISQNYEMISSAAVAQAAASPKIVAWLEWWPAGLYNPLATAATIAINFAAYKQQYVMDAGASILNATTLQSFILNNETVQPQFPSATSIYILANRTDVLRAMLKDVDIVIDEARYIYGNYDGDYTIIDEDPSINLQAFLQLYGLNASDVSNLKFLRNNGLLREDGLDGPQSFTEWFELAVVRPDQVLSDLVTTLYPSTISTLSSVLPQLPYALVQTTKPYYLRNVISGQLPVVLTSQECPLNGCTIPMSAICPSVYLACNGSLVYATPSQPCAPACPSPPVSATTPPHAAPPPSPSPGGAARSSRSLVNLVVAMALLSTAMMGCALWI